MHIPDAIKEKYRYDTLHQRSIEQYALLENFDLPESSKVFCVGCANDVVPSILSTCRYEVRGIDLIPPKTNPNFYRIVGDFCDDSRIPLTGLYDAVICLNSLSYFGMGNYGETPTHPYYDVLAMRRIWKLLKAGGTAFISVPVGAEFIEHYPHWRIYNRMALAGRLLVDFELVGHRFFTTAPLPMNEVTHSAGTILDADLAFRYTNFYSPQVIGFFRLKKLVPCRQAHPVQLNYTLPEGQENLYNYDQPYIYAEWNPQPDDVCVDVGTGSGTWSLAALNRGAKAIIFEPKAKYVKMFTDAAVLNNFTNYTLIEKGLSDSVGQISFNEEHGRCENAFATISVTTLDQYFEENQLTRLDYVNMDVEGHELHVLRGARQTLSKLKPKVIVEVHLSLNVTFEQVEKELRECGYSNFRRMNDILIATRD